METTSTREELDHLVRTLSHDMSANFMLLENSFSQLKKSLLKKSLLNEPLCRVPHEGGSPDEVRGQIAHVEACLRQSKRFLDDLVWLGRTGRVEMEPCRVELAGVVEEALFEQCELLAGRKIEVEIIRPLPVVWCNKGRLKQIVTNLLRNAAHHGCSPTHPRVTIAPYVPGNSDEASQGRAAAFQIHDNGPGVDRRFCREIFLPGRRLASTSSDGSGMGLAIVKKIVDHYGGSVYVAPDCPAGTAFVVLLPEPLDQTSLTPSAAEPLPEPMGRNWKLQVDGRHGERQRRQLHETVSP